MNTRKFRKLAYPFTDTLVRGFYVVRHHGRDYAVRVGHHLVDCNGEAHREPHIDNCGVCAPLWGLVPVPLSCGTLDDYRRLRECEHIGVGDYVRSITDGDCGDVRAIDVNLARVEVAWESGFVTWTAARDLEVRR
jgi:hypothetical protein